MKKNTKIAIGVVAALAAAFLYFRKHPPRPTTDGIGAAG